ncbi:asparagine synthase (glutamine-hydrolyzing), partial [bacterium]|nr:asparagine synthase (glutamine-hydrolyzing) [bacterium]
MCGIAGQYCIVPEATLSPLTLQQQSEAIRHRGPDEEGHWTNTVIAMAHRRLAIQDFSGGSQPMTGSNDTVLNYNGVIYNHQELRTELEVRGHRFQTRSDPEVLLAAYNEWGSDAWQRLNGMFAFALWDGKRQSFHLVRDRLGVKPLYYSLKEGSLYFASEPSALLRCPGVSRAIEPQALLNFLLYFQPVSGSQTLLSDIQMLEPGCALTADASHTNKSQWWKPEATSFSMDRSLDETAIRGRIRYLLQAAVQRQISADVPVGACLSGGLDSTILTGLFSQMAPEKPPTYTICLEGDEEEAGFATLAANHFGTRHKNFTISADEFFRGMEELTSIRNLPLIVPNEVLIYLLAQRMAPEVKVALMGEGADELFGGYTHVLSAVEAKGPHSGSSQENEWTFLLSLYQWFSKDELQSLLIPELAKLLTLSSENSLLGEAFSNIKDNNLLSKAFLFLEYHHLPGLLGRLDGATMAGSVEGRVPYTDGELVDFILSIPDSLKYPGNSKPDKYLLRKTFEDLIPAQ